MTIMDHDVPHGTSNTPDGPIESV